jgi:hypothetical protein
MARMLLVSIILLVLGVSLVRRGLRGSVVDDHPWCTACRFDLVGILEVRERCPECGADLSLPNSVEVGQRRRRPRMISLGVVLVVSAGVCMAGVGTGAFRRINWSSYKPHVWLRLEAEYLGDASRHLAEKEILRRAQSGILSADQLDQAIARGMTAVTRPYVNPWSDADRLLALLKCPGVRAGVHRDVLSWVMKLQGDPAQAFPSILGDVVHRAFLDGDISDEEFMAFLKQSCSPVLRAAHSGPVTPGEDLRVRIDWNWRGGEGPYEFVVDVPLQYSPALKMQYAGWFGGPQIGLEPSGGLWRAPSAPGNYTIEGKIRIGSGTQYLLKGIPLRSPIVTQPRRPLTSIPEVAVEFPISLEVQVVSDLPDMQGQRIRNQVASMFQLSEARVEVRGQSPAASLTLALEPFTESVSLQFVATWRSGDRVYRLGVGRADFNDGSVRSTFDAGGDGTFRNRRRWSRSGTPGRLSLRAPVHAEGPGRGVLSIEVTTLSINGEPSSAVPFSFDLPDVRVIW